MGDCLATIDMGRNLGAVPLLGGAGFPSNTVSLGRGLPPYQVASWSIQPFHHNRHGPTIGVCAPFLGGAGSPSDSVAGADAYLCAKFHLDPSNRFATIHERHRQTHRTDRQTTDR